MVDSRNPLLHLNESLMRYVEKHHKHIMVVFTKVDLIGEKNFEEWQTYLQGKWGLKNFVGISSLPLDLYKAEGGTVE